MISGGDRRRAMGSERGNRSSAQDSSKPPLRGNDCPTLAPHSPRDPFAGELAPACVSALAPQAAVSVQAPFSKTRGSRWAPLSARAH
jgi:hypothetical protein